MLGNKKAVGIDDFIPAVAVLILGLIIFGMFKFNENYRENEIKDDIQIQKGISELNEALFDYLNRVDDNGNKKIDAISKLAFDKNFDAIKKDMQEYFESRH